MAVKIADTLKALSNTFPVAECIDIDVNINGTTKRLQKAIDDGEIGGGSYSTWKGTHEEWEVLSTEEKGKYEVVYFTNDYDDSGSDSLWKGTREEWGALSTEEKGKYEVVYFTDDYDDSGIGEIDSLWKGTLEEWEALSTEEKGKYEVVYLTNDYDDSILIDDSNISNKTTYSSTKIENSLDKKANKTDLTSHTSDTSIHVTTYDKTKWNKVDNKIDKTDIVDNLTSTNTDKPLSANQGKVLNDKIGLKANTTDLTTHTSNTGIHVTTAERTKWNKVDNKVDKTDITTTIDSSSTDTKVPSAKAVNELNLRGTRIDQSVIDKYGTEIVKYPLGRWYFYNNSAAEQFSDLPVKLACIIDITSISNTGNPWDNTWSYRIYKAQVISNQGSFVRQLQSRETAGVLADTGWRKVCTTSVADVPVTNIAPADETKFIGFKGNSMCNYCVVNGVCYVTLWNVKVSVTGRSITGVMLPMPKSGFFGGACLVGGGDAEPHAYAHIIPETGELKFNVKDPNVALYGSFSYPVAEE